MDDDSAARRGRSNQLRGVLYPSLLPGGQGRHQDSHAHSSPAPRRGTLNPTPLRSRPVESPEHHEHQRPRNAGSATAHGGSGAAGHPQQLQRIAELERLLEHERARREEAEYIVARVESACNETVSDLNAKLRELTAENRSLRQAMAESRLQREVDGVRVAVAAESTERRRDVERVDRALAEHDGILRHVMALLTSSSTSSSNGPGHVSAATAAARGTRHRRSATASDGRALDTDALAHVDVDNRRSQSLWTARSSAGSAVAEEPETTTAVSRRLRQQAAAAYNLSQPVSPGSPQLEHTQTAGGHDSEDAGVGETSAAAAELSDSLQLEDEEADDDDGDDDDDDGDDDGDGGARGAPTRSDEDQPDE